MEAFKEVCDICQSMHRVASADYIFGIDSEDSKKSVLPCRLNPERLLCTCKACRHHGICSHILAVSHTIGAIDLRREFSSIGPIRQNHRPNDATGGQHIQPDEGEEPEVDYEDCEEQDLEEL